MPDFFQKMKDALQEIIDRLKSKSPKKKDSPIQECPYKKKDKELGAAVVIVSREDKNQGISGVQVTLEGPTPGSDSTNDIGFAQFDDREPGAYTYKANFPSSQFQPYNIDGKGQYVPVVEGHLAVAGGGVAIAEIKAYPTGDLKVSVVDETGKAVPEIDVKDLYTDALSPQALSEKNKNDHTFTRVKCGDYTVSVQVPNTLYADPVVTKTKVNVPEGGVSQAQLVVKLLNVAEPHIDADRKELWFEPKVPDAVTPVPLHLAKADAAPPAAEELPIKLYLYYTETQPEKPFKEDGILSLSNGNVKVFTDAQCTTPLVLPAQIQNADLKKGLDVYVQGEAAGAVTATLTLKSPADTAIRVRSPAQQTLTVKASNVVEPRLEVEYKVVLLDRKLSDHQESTEKKIIAEPTYILVSAKQYRSDPPDTKGAMLKADPGNVEVFTDEQCQDKDKLDLSQPIPHNKLFGGSPRKLYLKGKTKGKFTLSLELEDPGNPKIRRLGPVKIEMGVVELEMKLHWHDISAVKAIQVDPDTDPVDTYYTNLKNKVLPDQKAMTDEEKVKTGRLLHAQSSNNNGRAKLIVQKLDAGQWPDGTDDYEILINRTNTSGAVELWDKEWEGNSVSLPAGPIKVKDLKSAEKTYWVEGQSVTNDFRQAMLDLTLDRPAKDAPAKEVKRYADWARFTVVQIKEIKIDYTATPGQAVAWNEPKKRFYINLKNDPDGRKITIGAQLSKKLKDVIIHLLLALDKDNMKTASWGIDLPATWKWKDITADVKHKDKADRKDLLHLSAKTDANGYAKLELTLSRFGGDKFQPGAYIEQDPHLAKYIHGHTDLEKKKPVLYKDSIQVWRKFWYKEVKVTGLNVAGFGNAADTYKDVKVEMIAATPVEMPRATANGLSPRVIYPKHMISYYLDTNTNRYRNNYSNDASDGLVVGDNNESNFFALATPENDKPVMIPMINVHALWVANGVTSAKNLAWQDSSAFPVSIGMDKKLLDPPLQAGKALLKGGRWFAEDKDPLTGHWTNPRDGALAAGDVSLDPSRNSPYAMHVKKPAAIVISPHGTRIKIRQLQTYGAISYLGTSYNDGIVNAYTPNDVQDFINTINHELGHSFKQVTKVRPAGIPAHPNQYDASGSHCNYNNKCCLMYESGPQATALNRYCPVCHPYVLVQSFRL